MKIEFERFLIAGNTAAESNFVFVHGFILCIERNHSHQDPVRLLLLNALSSYYIEAAKSLAPGTKFSYASDGQEKSFDDLILISTQLLNRAEQINRLDVFTLIGKGNVYTRSTC